MIKADKLTKYYGKQRGILDIDLHVEPNEIFGFIGPNGAGKSTLIRTLLGLISASSGSSSIMGFDSWKDKEQLLASVGYMPSEALFYGNSKVKDIITLSAKLRGQAVYRQTSELVDRFDIDINKRIDELSLGNRKKVSIVCAFQHEPPVYLLDEPTSGLDPLMRNEFFKLLAERKASGATVFLSSHVLSEIQHSCDRAAFIKEGRIIQNSDIKSMATLKTKKVVLNTRDEFHSIEGVHDLTIMNSQVSFLYTGEINQLLDRLSGMKLENLSISDPDLEEMFMHFYGDNDHA
ncbi:MAG: ABC transporter ATP-binding protein [Erysipelothrix sp.]|jgi:ABC-2 type transport system ATP-binding protein|nr:ABC transporter ATP-binding protein [Erysipelothrix sp.]